MRINYNVQAMNANLALNQADNRVSQSIARLSSGFKVAAAKDSPSGYAMSKRMNMQIEGLSRATQSSNDAISVISIADGALSEVAEMIQRMSELATKAANGTMSREDREICQDEINQLKEEIARVSKTTEFNGQTLLDGSFDLKGYTDNTNVKIATYSDETPVKKYELDALQLEYKTDDQGNYLLDSKGRFILDPEKVIKANETLSGTNLPADAKVSAVDGALVTISAANDFSITLSIRDAILKSGAQATPPVPDTSAGKVENLKMDITGLGPMDMQIGANEDQIIAIRIPTLSLELMSIDDADVTTEENAGRLMEDTKTALRYVSDVRSRLGAYQNRLEHTVNTLNVTNEAMTSAYSGLVDADMAEETVNYSTQQIISQAATSVLAQANDRPSSALQLLQ